MPSEFKKIDWDTVGVNSEPLFGPVCKGFIKKLISDFHVKEINLRGEIVSLTDISCPETPLVKTEEINVSEGVKNTILEFYHSKMKFCDIECPINKEDRTYIHQYIKNRFDNLDSYTIKEKKVIRVKKISNIKKKLKQRRDKNCPNFISFVLYKENVSTVEAIKLISKNSKVKIKEFSFSGAKDKRAITVQEATVSKTTPFKLHQAIYNLETGLIKFSNNILIGNLKYVQNPLKLGDLKGNYFEIIIREFDEISNINRENIFEKILSYGFPNFFGKQRFGVGDVKSHLVGSEIIKENYNLVVDYILCERQKNSSEIKSCLEMWHRSKSSSEALKIITSKKERFSQEFKLLFFINQNNNVINEECLSTIPHQTQTMYLHAFQSFVWNQVLSYRIKKYGTSVLSGDLVPDSHSYKILTESEIKNNSYSILDIVHPMPGFDVIYPKNEIRDIFVKFMAVFGVSEKMFNHRIKKFKLSGTYRNIFVKPNDFLNQILPESDEKCLLKFDKENFGIKSFVDEKCHFSESKKLRALQLTFSLPSSSYATSLLREIVHEKT